MTELNLDNPELHSDWYDELWRCRKEHYGTNENLADFIDIPYLDCFWFFKGDPVCNTSFNKICTFLGYDAKKVQLPKEK